MHVSAKGSNMPQSSTQKARMLHILQILQEETDAEYGLTREEIEQKLHDKGISSCERKAFYRDIQTLQECGYPIGKLPTRPTKYHLSERSFTYQELQLLIDSIQNSQFLTKRQSNSLVKKLKKMAPRYKRDSLEKRMHLIGRIKSTNESVYKNVDIIQEALNLQPKKNICFTYFKYGFNKRKIIQPTKNQSQTREIMPLDLIYREGYYYLTGFDSDSNEIKTYRLDRMDKLLISKHTVPDKAILPHYDINEHLRCSFEMYSGEKTSVDLRIPEHLMPIAIDQFGDDIKYFDDTYDQESNSEIIQITVEESPIFYSWLTKFEGQIKIVKPQEIAKNYVKFLKKSIDTTEE